MTNEDLAFGPHTAEVRGLFAVFQTMEPSARLLAAAIDRENDRDATTGPWLTAVQVMMDAEWGESLLVELERVDLSSWQWGCAFAAAAGDQLCAEDRACLTAVKRFMDDIPDWFADTGWARLFIGAVANLGVDEARAMVDALAA